MAGAIFQLLLGKSKIQEVFVFVDHFELVYVAKFDENSLSLQSFNNRVLAYPRKRNPPLIASLSSMDALPISISWRILLS